MPVNELTSCLVIILLFMEVRSQVCTKTLRGLDTPCPGCPPIEVDKTNYESIPFTSTITECCPGYRKFDINKDPSSSNCVRICGKYCNNGYCSVTDECICYNFYEKYPLQSNVCVPKCNSGYKRVNGVCQPHCSTPCSGRKCVAPEQCSCDQGWQINEKGECSPSCNPECGYGTCVEGNKCTCWVGYELKENASPRCVPSCRNCQGLCVAPGKCECREHYTPKHLTADNRDCDCLGDCDTKCSKTICVPSTSATPPLQTTTVSAATTHTTTLNSKPKPTESIRVVVYRVPRSKSPPAKHHNEQPTQKHYDWKNTFWVYYFAFTVIVSFVLSGYIIWELCKK